MGQWFYVVAPKLRQYCEETGYKLGEFMFNDHHEGLEARLAVPMIPA